MQFRLVAAAFAELDCRTRTPFRFGACTVTRAPLLHLSVQLEAVDGRAATGMASDLLVPRWFRKDLPPGAGPTTPAEDLPALDQRELRGSALAAVHAALQLARPLAAFDLWQAVYRQRVLAAPAEGGDLLVRSFGVALLERAVLDAACRLAGKAFWSALQTDLFGVRLDAIHAELPSAPPSHWLPERPTTRVLVRHTVGMLDPLRDGDGPVDGDDGEPRSVEGYLRRDRLRWLKVKVGQGLAADRDRLLALARLCREVAPEVRFTLDGNEQFASLGAVADLLDAVRADPDGAELLRRTAHVEQPLPRAAMFDAAANRDLPRVTAVAPLCLDEADAEPTAFPRALALGWRGCSAKNCKGVFRALANAALARHRGGGAFVCGEDLTNLPVLALQQDLATMGALGIAHVERNGHHYFRGLDHLPEAVQQAAAAAHGDLYTGAAPGGFRLRIADGALEAASLLGRGYGCDAEPFAALSRELPWQPVE